MLSAAQDFRQKRPDRCVLARLKGRKSIDVKRGIQHTLSMGLMWIRVVFAASAVYDLVLGVAFLFAAPALFDHFETMAPNHFGYVQFPAILLILFAVMFARVAMDPVRHREFMLYGAGLKAAYAGTVLFYHQASGVPGMWLPFAYADLVFLVLFLIAWFKMREAAEG